MEKENLSHFHKATCNNILKYFCANTKNIERIDLETGSKKPNKSDIEEHFNLCLDYLTAQEMIEKVSEEGYELTEEGKCFYQEGGFS